MEKKKLQNQIPKANVLQEKRGRNKSVTEAKERIVKVNMLLHVGA